MIRSQRAGGFAAIEFALAAGALVFPVAILVASLPTWIEYQSMARVAAAEASRTVAAADDLGAGIAAADALVDQIAANHDAAATLDVEGVLARGGTITATVSVEMPALVLPMIGSVGGFRWSASRVEPVDLYRSFP